MKKNSIWVILIVLLIASLAIGGVIDAIKFIFNVQIKETYLKSGGNTFYGGDGAAKYGTRYVNPEFTWVTALGFLILIGLLALIVFGIYKAIKAKSAKTTDLKHELTDMERKIKRIKLENTKRNFKKIALIAGAFMVCILAFTIMLNIVIIPNVRYSNATNFMSDGKYLEANHLFAKISKHKDSRELLTETVKKQLQTAKAGDIVYFGSYKGKPIAWNIVSLNDESILLCADDIVDEQPYNNKSGGIDPKEPSYNYNQWANCSLRTWLNNDFYSTAFSEDEKESIIESNIGTTQDKVYIFTTDEYKNKDIKANTDYTNYWCRGPSGTNGLYAQTRYAIDYKASGLSGNLTQKIGVVPVISLKRVSEG